MFTPQKHVTTRILRTILIMAPLALLLATAPLSAQQTNVTRFDVYGGYAFLNSSAVNLFENGFAVQIGVRPTTWLSLGFDYNLAAGDLTIKQTQLLPKLQAGLTPAALGQLIQLLKATGQAPATYQPPSSLTVPAHSRTQTYTIGPELVYRHFTKATIFVRPLYAGIIHETATPKPQDPLVKALVFGLHGLPGGLPDVPGLLTGSSKTDNVFFYGFGGGFDILFNNHFAWRVQSDLVRDHLFNDLLTDSRWTVRFSTGPAFNFGKNIVK